MRNRRLWAYIAIVLAMVSLTLGVPRAWATPDQQGDTIPTPFTPTDWLYLPFITSQQGGTVPTPFTPTDWLYLPIITSDQQGGTVPTLFMP